LLATGGEFQTASVDGAIAFYTTEEGSGELHLFRYKTSGQSSESVASKVKGVLGASVDGAIVYYQDQSGLKQWQGGTMSTVASGTEAALPSDYPPATGTARLSPDGQRLLFLSAESLSGYDTPDATTGQADSEVFLWNLTTGSLICISCNPTAERPSGPSTISGSYANGTAPGSTDAYKPRNLSAIQNRAFFETGDSLLALDTNKGSDVYQWEGQGAGSCGRPGGCLRLISSGTDPVGTGFLDASESGDDAYIRTLSSLQEPQDHPHMTTTPQGNTDPGAADVYDARVGGGFPEPPIAIPCEGDACVPLPQPPEDPTVGTLIPGLPNPPIRFQAKQCPKRSHRVTRKGRTVCIKHPHKKKGGHR
jgi:hypothetical protein